MSETLRQTQEDDQQSKTSEGQDIAPIDSNDREAKRKAGKVKRVDNATEKATT